MPKQDTQFKKGQSGNPAGRSKADGELATLRTFTKEQLVDVYNALCFGTKEDLEKMLAGPDTPFFVEWTIRLAFISCDRGDLGLYRELLDRLLGKIPDKSESEINHKYQIIKEVEGYTDEEIKAKLPLAIKMLQEKE